MIIIDVPQRLTHHEIETLIERSYKFGLRSPGVIRFDFTRTVFASSYAMILFILLCDILIHKYRKRITCKLSETSKLHSCMYVLSRLGLFEEMPGSVTYYPFKPRTGRKYKSTNKAILEITKIKNLTDAQATIELVENAVIANTNFESSEVYDICTMVSEMLQNIVYHSGSENAGIIAIQNYPKLCHMQIVIADVGVGIPVTISQAKEYEGKNLDDVSAILESMKEGVSRHGKGANRGEGLSRCVELSQKHRALLNIRSNKGRACFTFAQGTRSTDVGAHLSGTQILINFPIQ